MLKINETYQAKIFDYTDEGYGVGRVEDIIVFVKNAQYGQRVEIKITTVKKNYCIGNLQKILEESPHSVPPRCPYANICDGCTFQFIDYDIEREIKIKKIKNALKKVADLNMVPFEFKGSIDPYHYRNKITLKIDPTGSLAYYNRATHHHVAINSCSIASQAINEIIPVFNDLIKNNKSSEDYKDILEICFRSNHENELMIIFRSLSKTSQWPRLIKEIQENQKVVSIYHEYVQKNKKPSGKFLHKKKEFRDTIGDTIFKISPSSFFQVHQHLTPILYKQGSDSFQDSQDKILLDLYCGIGTFSIFASPKFKKVIGVELVKDSIKDAKINNQLNKRNNCEFLAGDVLTLLPDLLNKENIEYLSVDPPRKGLNEKVIPYIGNSHIKNIVYISCNPSTLARDIQKLKEYGFVVKNITGVDMFPRTTHVETVCLLSNLNSDQNI